ncbi:sulfur carrier protein ThiS [Arsenicicoccus sp. oral taxon 190]|uniref:sulfur carrier protein ThiS n=1 Tax=Arsenicicoccus sp. oral taxon 190 TaxID=1658671 RepID=UPI00067A15FB|nr:sulfur carrier protein ThiS [Arsenicicoccus sp. oral taxon 190]AKT50263.1 thiamine biosynthesis protein ThiS [Arsenicicoccus sp. oral taxon 190]
MKIVVNGDTRDVPDACDVAALVEHLGLVPQGIAVAVDEHVVPRTAWTGRTLVDGDRVEIVTAMQGG